MQEIIDNINSITTPTTTVTTTTAANDSSKTNDSITTNNSAANNFTTSNSTINSSKNEINNSVGSTNSTNPANSTDSTDSTTNTNNNSERIDDKIQKLNRSISESLEKFFQGQQLELVRKQVDVIFQVLAKSEQRYRFSKDFRDCMDIIIGLIISGKFS